MTAASRATEDQAWALLRSAETAWRQLDPQALIATLRESTRTLYNFDEPICGVEAAAAWIELRQKIQPDYVLAKHLRGIYGGNAIVSQWTENSAGTPQRGIGIELLAVDGDGLITHWDAVKHAEPR